MYDGCTISFWIGLKRATAGTRLALQLILFEVFVLSSIGGGSQMRVLFWFLLSILPSDGNGSMLATSLDDVAISKVLRWI